MNGLDHPLKDVLGALRQVILETSPDIGEEIKWNAPTFFYSGELEPSDPKEYRRYLVISNFFKKDAVRLVFWQGGRVNDTSGLLEGDYTDGRRLASFSNLADVAENTEKLQDVIRQQLRYIRQ